MKMKPKKRILTLLVAVMLCIAAFPLTAYASGGEETPEVTEAPAGAGGCNNWQRNRILL